MILKGVWRIGMDRMELPDGTAPWAETMPSRHFTDRIHRFDWLPSLFTQGTAGADRACYLVDNWIHNFGRFDGFSWRVGCTADRVWNWMVCGAGLLENGDSEACATRLDALGRQLRHVSVLAATQVDPATRWRAATLDVVQSVCLARGKGLNDALMQLESECTAQFFADGGHVSRSPARALKCFSDLVCIDDILTRSDRILPDFLPKWIARIGGMISFLQTGDGALPPFHDSDESRPEAVNAALSYLSTPPRRFSVAPKSGFHKLQKGNTLLLLDAGGGPELPFGDGAHAGALGFELHDGPIRIVTSCGFSPEVGIEWQSAVRATSAHSTLVIDSADSSTFKTNDETDLLYPEGPEGISAKRLEEADEIWLDAQHGGYKADYGLLHRRRLFMSGTGSRLTGEDSLARPVSAGAAESDAFVPFDLRFHLHPTITAIMASDGIILESDRGRRWRFKTSHARARLESTIYLGRGLVERSEQIVLSAKADPSGDGSAPPNCVRWAFLREKAS
ncbi:MAG: heparinase II/III family protein [Pseudomonadota bacterium]